MPKSDGWKNLRPSNQRTKDEHRLIAQKGGKKSGEVRRQKRDMRAEMIAALDAVDEEGLTERQKLIRRVVDMAQKSQDPRWIKMAAELSGEMPDKKVNIEAEVTPRAQIHILVPDNGRARIDEE